MAKALVNTLDLFSSKNEVFVSKEGNGSKAGPTQTSSDATSCGGNKGGDARELNVKPIIDNTSSNYPSLMPSFQPSPARSQTHEHSLNIQDLKNLELSPFRCR